MSVLRLPETETRNEVLTFADGSEIEVNAQMRKNVESYSHACSIAVSRRMVEDAPEVPPSSTDLLLAAVLLGRFFPLAPHHSAAIRERLHELNDNELRSMVTTGKWPSKE